MTVTRPRRLTTVVTEPMLLPIQMPPASEEQIAAAPDHPQDVPPDYPPEQSLEQSPEPPRQEERPKVEVLSTERMRPRRVIVVK